MTAAASLSIKRAADPLDVFVARCAARAWLYASGDLDLIEA